jgi:hypothetical protein
MRSDIAVRDATLPANLAGRAAIHRFEGELAKLPQIELRVDHHFTDGVYMRSMFIPAGVALVGHIHRHPCISIVQYGEIVVATEHGAKRIVGPATFESPAGHQARGVRAEGHALHHHPREPHQRARRGPPGGLSHREGLR